MKRTAYTLLFAFLSLLFGASASAQMKPEDAIKFRKAAFNVMGYNFGSIGAMVNAKKPYNKAEAERNANAVGAVAHMPYELFGPGTDKGETRAKPEVWSEPDKFKAAADKMQAEVVKLVAAARGDEAGLKAQFGEVGKACKACHDNYRKE
jgi:cytochrome c556